MPAPSPDSRPFAPEASARTRNSLQHNELPRPPYPDRWVFGAVLILAVALAGCTADNFTLVCGSPLDLIWVALIAGFAGGGLGFVAWELHSWTLKKWDLSESSSAPRLISDPKLWIWGLCVLIVVAMFVSMLFSETAADNCGEGNRISAALLGSAVLLLSTAGVFLYRRDNWRKKHSDTDN